MSENQNTVTDEKNFAQNSDFHPRCALVGVRLSDDGGFDASFAELSRLCNTAGGEVVFTLVQNMEKIVGATYIGSGKLSELADLCSKNDVHVAIFDCELSPMQVRTIEDKLDDVRVIDRSVLILDIFALHAGSAAGKLQVEIAQLRYTLPRLVGKGKDISRLAGGIGTRGPGESKLESDKRHIERRIRALEDKLSELEHNRKTQREQRNKSGIAKAAIVGYTNAGKSTLLNRLTDAGILAEDKLFATLDPTTRRFALPSGREMLLTDTVGFIRNLPHHLVKAFKSTLDEIVFADFLIVVADMSDYECASQIEVTRQVISELGAAEKPVILVLNKCDIAKDNVLPPEIFASDDTVFISAATGDGIDKLASKLDAEISKFKTETEFIFPYDAAKKLSYLHGAAEVKKVDCLEDGIHVSAVCDEKTRGMFAEYREVEI